MIIQSFKLHNGMYLLRYFKPIEEQGNSVVHYLLSKQKTLSCKRKLYHQITPKFAFDILINEPITKTWKNFIKSLVEN